MARPLRYYFDKYGVRAGIVAAVAYVSVPLQRLFAPRGNLLVADILVEATIHILSSGERKAVVSKFDDGPDQPVRQALVQAMIFSAAELAQQGKIRIDWELVSRACPQPPAAPPPPPAAPPP